MAKDTPLWDVMLQSAQVINQSFQLEQKAMAEQQRLELEAKRMADLQAAREEKIRMQEEALTYKQQADQAKMEVEWARIQNQSRGLEIRETETTNREIQRKRQNALAQAREARLSRASTSEQSAYNAADKIVAGIEEDANRVARTGDKIFDEKNLALYAMDQEKLANRYAKLTDVDAMDELIIKELSNKYPQYATVAEQKEAEKLAINRILVARTEEFNSRAERTKEAIEDPKIRKWFITRDPSVRFAETLEARAGRTAKSQVVNPGTAAMGATVDKTAPPPIQAVPGMTQYIADAQRIRVMDTSTKEGKAAKVAAAAALVNQARNSAGPDNLNAAVQQILYELSGSTDMKDTFIQDIKAEMVRRGFSAQGRKAPARSSK